MSRGFKEKIREVFREVKKEDFEQKVKEFNDLKNKKSNPYSIALGTANFEAYKSEYLNMVNSPYSDKKAIIQSLKNKTKKLLEKKGDVYNQIRLNKEVTIFLVDPFDKYHYYTKKHEVIELMKFEEYLIEQENNKIETNKPDETKKELHSDIFKGNAFELFRKYYTEEELGLSSRTDLNLLFQLFERYNLFVETVELKHYIRWLNKNGYYEDVELKKVDINSRPNRQRKNAFKRYANDLKITLK